MAKKIVLLVGASDSSWYLYNALRQEFEIERVIVESHVSRKKFLKRRIKRLGYLEVLGQVLFQGLCVPVLRRFSKRRIEAICAHYGLSDEAVPADKLTRVSSVNSQDCRDLLQQLAPSIIIVNGTRIIGKKTLAVVTNSATIVNTHAGITPKYRGVHGGYWALANKDAANCGVTVHLIDRGIDTGGILFQERIKPTGQDNFITYTFLQVGEGISLMRAAIHGIDEGKIRVQTNTLPSKLWYHPTIWGYLWRRWLKGVR